MFTITVESSWFTMGVVALVVDSILFRVFGGSQMRCLQYEDFPAEVSKDQFLFQYNHELEQEEP